MLSRLSRVVLLCGIAAVVVLFSLDVTHPWAGIVGIALALVLAMAGLAVVDLFGGEESTGPELVASALGLGICVGLLSWVASSYLIRSLWPGTALILTAAVMGARNSRRLWNALGDATELLEFNTIGTVALFFGAYVFGYNEIIVGSELHFSFLTDWAKHLLVAASVRELGLPLHELSGYPGIIYAGAVHVGYGVLVAGAQQITQCTLFETARWLGVIGLWLIPISAFALIRSRGLASPLVICASLTSLFWSGGGILIHILGKDWEKALNPYQNWILGGVPSGSLLHNSPQLFSVCLVAVGALLFSRYTKTASLRALMGFSLMLGCSALIKPVLVIVVVPALAISMIVARRTGHLVLIVLVMAAFGLLYNLPLLYADEFVSHAVWHQRWKYLLKLSELRRTAVLGIGTVVVGYWLYSWMRVGIKRRDLEWIGVLVISFLGAAVFAVVFRETGRGHHGNHSWPLSAATVLLIPHLVATLFHWVFSLRADSGLTRRSLQIALIVMLAVHMGGAAVYVARYPHLLPRSLSVSYVNAMQKARALTRPEDRFLVDPSLTRIYPPSVFQMYLARSALWRVPASPEVHSYSQNWTRLEKPRHDSSKIIPFLKAYDALICTDQNPIFGITADTLGWARTSLDPEEELVLWQRPRPDRPSHFR
jgi:hypothetical protein